MSLHPNAAAAIRAAKNLKFWGLIAAMRYVQRQGCPQGLLTLARQLESAK